MKIRKSFEAASRGIPNNQNGQGQGGNGGQKQHQKKGGGGKGPKKGGLNKQVIQLQKQLKTLKRRQVLTPQQKAEKYRDVSCHGCGNKGHIKRLCPNRDAPTAARTTT